MTEDDGPWVVYMRGGVLMKRRPWCDCTREHQIKVLGRRQAVGVGFTRRDDGAYVRPCCMRRAKEAWLKHGDSPKEHDPLTCPYCTGSQSERAHLQEAK